MNYIQPGTILHSRYKVLGEMGRGAHSIVYKAEDQELQMNVALKQLIPPPILAHLTEEKTRREVLAVRSLQHPHIVRTFDLLRAELWDFIVMELVDGPNLKTAVTESGCLSAEAVARIGQDIAGALAIAHRRGILHRDIKPQNILLDGKQQAYLADFGSARIEGQKTLTATGALIGTLDYTAPEVVAGERGDARADIYALGLTLYYTSTGQLPPCSTTRIPHPASDGFHPRQIRSDLPVWLDEVVSRATKADPSKRFLTAAELQDALAQKTIRSLSSTSTQWESNCLICGAADPLRLEICPNCRSDSLSGGKTLTVLQDPGSKDQRQQSSQQLARLLGLPGSTLSLREVVLGRKPLISLPEGSSDRVLTSLSELDIEARIVPMSQSWKMIPASYYGLLMAVIGVGSLVSWWSSPLVAATLWGLAYRTVRDPLLEAPVSESPFPKNLQVQLIQTLGQLPTGTGRNLLIDLIRLGHSLFLSFQTAGIRSNLEESLSELLGSSCQVAIELHQLDVTLAQMERRLLIEESMPEEWLVSLSECEQARDRLAQRFLEAIAATSTVRKQISTSPDSVGQRLAQLTADLRVEVDVHIETARDMAALIQAGNNAE